MFCSQGAPEAMERTLRKPLPKGYKRGHKSLAARGYRVIALCAKRWVVAKVSVFQSSYTTGN